MNTAVATILTSLRNEPDEWSVRKHTLYHTRKGLELWRSNGWVFVSVWKIPGSNEEHNIFSLWEKFRIYRAMQKIVKAHAAYERAEINCEIVALFREGATP